MPLLPHTTVQTALVLKHGSVTPDLC